MVEVPYTIPDEQLVAVYNWIDEISFSRRRKDISRDFSDGVLCAELIAKFLPRLVDLHNYTPCCRLQQKTINWDTLNRKVLSKLGITISASTVKKLVESKHGTIEQVLWDLKKRVEEAVRTYPQMCRSSPLKNAISTCSRPPTAKVIREPRPVSAIPRKIQPKRQQPVPKQSIEVKKKAQPQQMSNSISSNSLPTAQDLLGKYFRAAPASYQNQPSAATFQLRPALARTALVALPLAFRPTPAETSLSPASSPPPAEISLSPASSFAQLPTRSEVSEPEPTLEEFKILPLSNVTSDDDCTTDDCTTDEENDFNDNECFEEDEENLINANVPAQILFNQRKVAKCFEEKEKQIKFLQSEITSLNMQVRRYKTLAFVKERRINELSHRLSAMTEHQSKMAKSAAAGSGSGGTGI